MEALIIGEQRIALDKKGYMEQESQWNEEVALALARREGIEMLTDRHWRVLRFLRQYYAEYGQAPILRKLCKQCDLDLQELYRLFPAGPSEGAWKLAGLPRPHGCV